MADAIPFTRGVPSADMLPVDDLRARARRRHGAGAGGRALVLHGRASRAAPLDRRALRRAGRARRLRQRLARGVRVRGRRACWRAPRRTRVLVEAPDLRPQHPDPAARRRERRRRPGRRRRHRHGCARGRARARARRVPVRDPELPEPERRDDVARAPPARAGAGRPARRRGRRGRPLRAPALGGRVAPDALRARRRRARDHALVVHQDGRARACGSATSSRPRRSPAAVGKYAENTYISPCMVSQAGLAAYCAGRLLRARRRARQGSR